MKRFVQGLMVAATVLVTPLTMTASVQAAEVPYGQTILAQGAKGTEVSALQKDLQDLGYFKYSNITGYYGSITTQAVQDFQRDHDLTPNGMVGMTTGPVIQQEAAQKNQPVAEPAVTAAPKLSFADMPHKKYGVFQYDHELGEFDSSSDAVAEAAKWDHCSVRVIATGEWVWSNWPTEANEIINTAKQYLCVHYQWGGTTPSGFDCSGFIGYVFAKNGYTLPRTATEMYHAGTSVSSPNVGDLVFFTTYKAGPSHVGVYLGNGQFISSSSSHGVSIASMSSSYWGPRYLGARHVL
ncbi:MAG: C40 family peptidase [Tumebacillaceae bacterium]